MITVRAGIVRQTKFKYSNSSIKIIVISSLLVDVLIRSYKINVVYAFNLNR